MSLRIELDMEEMIYVMQSINDYKQLCSHFNQIDGRQTDTLNVYYDRMKEFSRDKKFIDQDSLIAWNKMNVHIIQQMWGSTACGWEGMGGAAMTASYTTIIEAIQGNAIFVYYNGKLAYVAEIDEKLSKYKDNGYKNLPGIRTASEILTTYYTYRR